MSGGGLGTGRTLALTAVFLGLLALFGALPTLVRDRPGQALLLATLGLVATGAGVRALGPGIRKRR